MQRLGKPPRAVPGSKGSLHAARSSRCVRPWPAVGQSAGGGARRRGTGRCGDAGADPLAGLFRNHVPAAAHRPGGGLPGAHFLPRGRIALCRAPDAGHRGGVCRQRGRGEGPGADRAAMRRGAGSGGARWRHFCLSRAAADPIGPARSGRTRRGDPCGRGGSGRCRGGRPCMQWPRLATAAPDFGRGGAGGQARGACPGAHRCRPRRPVGCRIGQPVRTARVLCRCHRAAG